MSFMSNSQVWSVSETQMTSSILSSLQLYLSLLFFNLGPRSFFPYRDFQSIWQDRLQKSQAYMLSAHSPEREEETQVPPKYPRENSGMGKCHIPLSENITKSVGMQYCDCQRHVPGSRIGVWYLNPPALRGTEKFLRGPE